MHDAGEQVHDDEVKMTGTLKPWDSVEPELLVVHSALLSSLVRFVVDSISRVVIFLRDILNTLAFPVHLQKSLRHFKLSKAELEYVCANSGEQAYMQKC